MDIQLTLPQKWDDLKPKQAKNISWAHHCYSLNQGHPNIDEIRTATFIAITKELLRYNSPRAINVAYREIPPAEYAPHLSWVFENEISLQEFPESYKIGGVRYYGPDYRLKNISIGEFSFADAMYYRYKQTNKELYLNLLCASLYRPRKKTADDMDVRIPFSKVVVEKYSDEISKLPLQDKVHICYAYEGSRNYMVNQFPKVFPKSRPGAKANYKPFGELISFKIGFDPSKLETVEGLLAYKFLGVYENELKQPKPR